MSKGGAFEWPKFYHLPPFFTTQPVLDTQRKQCELWADLILAYCKHNKIQSLSVSDALELDLFHNRKINRRLSKQQIIHFLDYLSDQGNVEWTDAKSKEKALIYYKTPSQWGSLIFNWAMDMGKVDTVCTLYEIQQGEDAEGREFYNLDSDTLLKALQALEKEGKAQTFSSSSTDNMGVKFFSI